VLRNCRSIATVIVSHSQLHSGGRSIHEIKHNGGEKMSSPQVAAVAAERTSCGVIGEVVWYARTWFVTL
jgi:hypothetical protein